jgi:hypothetical protein
MTTRANAMLAACAGDDAGDRTVYRTRHVACSISGWEVPMTRTTEILTTGYIVAMTFITAIVIAFAAR